ncbi:hypothetical protein D3C73_652330 [compost metagenome]
MIHLSGKIPGIVRFPQDPVNIRRTLKVGQHRCLPAVRDKRAVLVDQKGIRRIIRQRTVDMFLQLRLLDVDNNRILPRLLAERVIQQKSIRIPFPLSDVSNEPVDLKLTGNRHQCFVIVHMLEHAAQFLVVKFRLAEYRGHAHIRSDIEGACLGIINIDGIDKRRGFTVIG